MGKGEAMDMGDAKILERLEAALEKLDRPVVPLSDQLWDTGDVARYFKRNPQVVRETITCQPSFPKAIRLPSKGKARAAALAQCRATGGGARCKVKAQYRNGCGAIAWGDTRYSTATGHDKETATSLAIEDCGKYTSNCKVYYGDCSLPERKWSGS